MMKICQDLVCLMFEQKKRICLVVLIGFYLIVGLPDEGHAQKQEQMEVTERDEKTGEPLRFTFNFTSQDMKRVLEWLSRETDLSIIANESDVSGKPFALINLNNVTLDEVIEKIKTVLAEYDLTFVRIDNTLLVTTFENAMAKNVPVKIIETNPELVEMTDEIQTYIIQLQNAVATEQVNALKPLLNKQANIYADATNNALVITDVSSTVRRVVTILQFADAGDPSPLKIAIMPLAYADAASIENTMNNLFDENDDEEDIKAGIPIGVNAEEIKQALAEGLGIDITEGYIKVFADENSNSVIIKASEDNLVIVQEIIRHLDTAPELSTEIKTYRLQYASAEDVATTLEELITGENIRNGRRSFDREDILEMLTYRRDRRNPENIFQGIVGLVNITRDDRLNLVIVSSDSRNFTLIDKIISELDQEQSQQEYRKYLLKNANAEGLKSLLDDLFETGTGDNEDRPWWERGRDDDSSSEGGFGVQGQVNIVFDARLNALIISTAKQNFEMIDDLIEELDVSIPEQEWGTKIFRLKYADAENVANLLNSHYGGSGSSTSNRWDDDWWWIRNRGQSSTQSQTQGSLAGNVSAEPFVNLNAVIVSTGTKRNFDMIEDFIKQIDVPTPEDQVEITETIRLEYATADAIAALLSQVWQDQQSDDEGFGFGRFFRQATTADEPTDINSLYGKVTVYADPDTNSLVVTTRRRYMEQVKLLIKHLDFVRGQVRIDIKILEVTLDETTKLGIEVAANEKRLGGLELAPDNPLIGGADAQLGLTQEISGFNYSLVTKEYMALLHTLIRENKVKTLSTPTITTRDSRPATWSSGRRIPYLQSVDTNSILGDTATQPLFNYDFIDPPVGINISLTPYIAKSQAGEDGKRTIGLDITNISASNFIEFTDFNAPITDDNTLSVYIDVEDGQQLIVGGIIRKKQKQVENKVPILGDIPLLGRLFKSTETEVQDTEIVFLITPHIIDIKNPADLEKLKEKNEEWLKNGMEEFKNATE